MAIKILETWNKKGYGNRHTIVEALLALDRGQANELIEGITRIEQLLGELKNNGFEKKRYISEASVEMKLNDTFLEAMNNNAREGVSG
jgi:hypothetical protein